MTKQNDWNPDHYLKFKNERTQPSIDLVQRITIAKSPTLIVDIGCGPGNSSQILVQRWPQARIIGVDSSPTMIERAKKDFPRQEWILADAMDFVSDSTIDIVFSNAAIQWIPNHKSLFKRLCKHLSKNGVIAIQIPKFHDMALGQIIHAISQKNRWKKETEDCFKLFTYHDGHYYYDLLADNMQKIDMWETDYIHVMPSHPAIIDWIKSTGLKPYLDRIKADKDKNDFVENILLDVNKYYPKQKDGSVLFPFKRLFFIGYK